MHIHQQACLGPGLGAPKGAAPMFYCTKGRLSSWALAGALAVTRGILVSFFSKLVYVPCSVPVVRLLSVLSGTVACLMWYVFVAAAEALRAMRATNCNLTALLRTAPSVHFCRLEVPACPVGVVYVAIITGSSHISVMQPLPVLSPAAAKQVQELQQLHQQQLQLQQQQQQEDQQQNDVAAAVVPPAADEEGDGVGSTETMVSMFYAAARREQWHSFMSPLLVDLCYAIASLNPGAETGAAAAGITATSHPRHTSVDPESVESGVAAGGVNDFISSAPSVVVMCLVRVFMAWGVDEPAAMLLQLWAQANEQHQEQERKGVAGIYPEDVHASQQGNAVLEGGQQPEPGAVALLGACEDLGLNCRMPAAISGPLSSSGSGGDSLCNAAMCTAAVTAANAIQEVGSSTSSEDPCSRVWKAGCKEDMCWAQQASSRFSSSELEQIIQQRSSSLEGSSSMSLQTKFLSGKGSADAGGSSRRSRSFEGHEKGWRSFSSSDSAASLEEQCGSSCDGSPRDGGKEVSSSEMQCCSSSSFSKPGTKVAATAAGTAGSSSQGRAELGITEAAAAALQVAAKPGWEWLLNGFSRSSSRSSTTAMEEASLERQYLIFKQRNLASNDTFTMLYFTAVALTFAGSFPGDSLALQFSRVALLVLIIGPSAAVVACRPLMRVGRRDWWVFLSAWMGPVVAVLLALGLLLPPGLLEVLLSSSGVQAEVAVLLSNGVVKPGLYRVSERDIRSDVRDQVSSRV